MKTFPLTAHSEFKTISLTNEGLLVSQVPNDSIENMQQQSPNQVLKMSLNDIEKFMYEKDDDILKIQFKNSFKAMPFIFENKDAIPQFLAEVKSNPQFVYSEKPMSVLEAAQNNIIFGIIFWIFGGMMLFLSNFEGNSGGKIGLFLRIVNLIKNTVGTIGLYIIIAFFILFPIWFIYGRIKYKPIKIELKHK